mmetsp:Transcript_10614/g.18639  ORF Transcript_10614/g.18639 Transcript_10614/m.18639 type:complete len:617 (+) Transcript_10614:143-1993(+)|eukprot:CAMPEP_0183726918 /NCGR_PEP_ID=MMETSP0737-20130205/24394_1 /TAXON_ID=385413 /ORGANISM="Thalassiosira miniscula, Strain CCMP1093" /LENGTH=616 /DNA_ID=CAMNT_0025958389 /DNA_START=138 /DNA_END=1988 /DNA_ORIENTATION=+
MTGNSSNQLSNNQSLTTQLMGILGGGGTNNRSAPMSVSLADATEKQSRHVVSEASSVISSSAGSLSSSRSSATSSSGPLSSTNGRVSSLSSRSGSGGTSPTAGEDKNDDGNGDHQGNPSANAPSSPSSSSPSASAPASGGTSGIDPMVLQMNAPPHPVAEFLFQLTKMLTDNNSEYIEWRNASIFVHDPPGLEKDILPKYFRHSNYSSFQRQMNYFGFRKIAGKGKMAPCSYVNEAAKEDISSLLFIKRKKTGVSSAAAKLMAQQNRINRSLGGIPGMGGMGIGAGNPALMMGNALGGLGGTLPGALSANSSLALNNLSMLGAGTAGNLNTVNGVGTSPLHLNEPNVNVLTQQQQQQNMLAQLQQAHASALTNSQGPGVGIGSSISPASQNKAINVGLGINNGNGNSNNVLLTNDQGNVYTNSNNPTDWSNNADSTAAAQSLLLQQATQGLSGNFPQGIGNGNGAGADSNGLVQLDSAANLRALINQQISMFNTPAAGDFASTMSNFGGALGGAASMPSTGMMQPQGSTNQQVNGLNSIPTGNASQGVSFDWNEMLRNMGGGGVSADNTTSNATASLQQLLQVSNNGAPGPAAPAQSFNLNGLFGSGGGAQGPFSA